LNNGLYRKIDRRARAQKDNPIYAPGAEDDAERIRKAGDGEWVKVRDPSAVGVVHTGGVDKGLMALQVSVMDVFDRMGGNVRAMAGLGSQGDTLGQDQIIQQNVSKKEAKMQGAVVSFTSEIAEDLGDLMWDSETLEIPGNEQIGTTGIYVDRSWKPGDREGTRDNFRPCVEPFSMLYRSPEQKVGILFQYLQQIAPLWPMFQQSGAILDVQRLNQIVAEYREMPEIAEIVTFGSPQQGSEDDRPRQSPVTTRNTVRQNVGSGANPQGQAQQLMMAAPDREQGVTRG
jgi:hypothetical protein